MRFRAVAVRVTFFACWLAGCGGGSVDISQQHRDRGPLPGQTVAHNYLAAKSATERQQLVQALAGSAGDDLDWAEFWLTLRAPGALVSLSRPEITALLDLHHRDCSRAAYRQFSFLAVDLGMAAAYLGPGSARCQTPLVADAAEYALRGLWRENRDDAASAFRFLEAQLRAQPSEPWASTLTPADGEKLRRQAAELARRDPLAVVRLGRQLQIAFGRFPFASELAEGGVFETQTARALQQELGAREAIAIFALAAAAHPPSQATAQALLDQLKKALPAETAVERWESFRQQRRLLIQLSVGWPIRARLAEWESLETLAETQLTGSARYLDDQVNQLEDPMEKAELLWLRARLAPGTVNAAEIPSAESARETIERVLLSRLRVYLSESTSSRAEAVQAFCRQLKAEGIAPSEIRAADLTRRLEQGLSAGCYHVPTEAALAIHSSQRLQSSVDSVLSLDGQDLSLDAREIALGVVDLSRASVPAPLAKQETPADFDALTIPLVLGIPLAAQQTQLWAGTHFFAVHVMVRSAQSGPADERLPQAGLPGGHLHLQSAAAASLAFVSAGGAPQAPAPRRDGGRGDQSQLNANVFFDWVTQLGNSERYRALPHPFSFQAAPASSALKELLEHGRRDGAGNILPLIEFEYLGQLPTAQRAKIARVCAGWGYDASNTNLFSCLKTRVLPLALAQLREALAREPETLATSARKVLPLVDSETAFILPPGATGPANTVAAPGAEGQIEEEKR